MSLERFASHKKLLILGAGLGFVGVILGAYGAHGLKPLVSADQLETFETGVRFQMYHAFLALILGGFSFIPKKALNLIFYLLAIGILFFSGSIYGLATNELSAFDFKKIALITPLGGMLLILAWGILLINILETRSV